MNILKANKILYTRIINMSNEVNNMVKKEVSTFCKDTNRIANLLERTVKRAKWSMLFLSGILVSMLIMLVGISLKSVYIYTDSEKD
jgi:hypothetical protein